MALLLYICNIGRLRALKGAVKGIVKNIVKGGQLKAIIYYNK